MTTATATLQLTLGEALKLVRERAGLTQKDMADRLELGRNTVARYESSHTTPRWRDVVGWAEEVGLDPATLRDYWERARECGWLTPSAAYGQSCVAGGEMCDGDQLALDRKVA